MECNLEANTLYFRSFWSFWVFLPWLLLTTSTGLTRRCGWDRNHCGEEGAFFYSQVPFTSEQLLLWLDTGKLMNPVIGEITWRADYVLLTHRSTISFYRVKKSYWLLLSYSGTHYLEHLSAKNILVKQFLCLCWQLSESNCSLTERLELLSS